MRRQRNVRWSLCGEFDSWIARIPRSRKSNHGPVQFSRWPLQSCRRDPLRVELGFAPRWRPPISRRVTTPIHPSRVLRSPCKSVWCRFDREQGCGGSRRCRRSRPGDGSRRIRLACQWKRRSAPSLLHNHPHQFQLKFQPKLMQRRRTRQNSTTKS